MRSPGAGEMGAVDLCRLSARLFPGSYHVCAPVRTDGRQPGACPSMHALTAVCRALGDMTGVAVLTVDSVGRRPLLLGGVGSIVVALLALGGAQTLLSGGAETWTSVAALLLYVGAYQARRVCCTLPVSSQGLGPQL